MPPVNPYDAVVRRLDRVRDNYDPRTEEVRAQSRAEVPDRRTVDAQRLSRQEGRPVTPDEAPDVLRAQQARDAVYWAQRSVSFARVFSNPALANSLRDDAPQQARVADAVSRIRTGRGGFRPDESSSAQIAAALDRREAEEFARHGWFWRVMHTDLTRLVGLDLRPEVTAAQNREDIARDDGFFDRVGDRFLRGFAQFEAGINDAGAAINDAVSSIRYVSGTPDDVRVGSSIFPQAGRDARDMRAQSARLREVAAIGREQDVTQAQADAAGFFSTTNATFVGQQAVLSGPSLAASLLGPLGMGLNAASNAGNIARARAENQGRLDPDFGDLVLATPFAIASAGLDRLSARTLTAAPLSGGVVGVLRRVFVSAGTEAATEGVQSTIEYTGGVVGTNEPWRARDAWNAARAGATVGFAVGGAVRLGSEPAHAGVNTASEMYQAARRRAGLASQLGDSEAQHDAISTIMDSATMHTSRTADVDAFREALQTHVEGTPIENVFIGVEAIDQYLQSEGAVDPAGIFRRYADQLAEARLTGGEVVIPLSEFAAVAAGTPAWDALREDARPSQSAMTPRELSTKRDEIMADLEARGAEIAAQSETQAPPAASTETITLNQSPAEAEAQGRTDAQNGAPPQFMVDPERFSAYMKGYNEVTPDAAPVAAPAPQPEAAPTPAPQPEATPTDPAVKVYDQVKGELTNIGYATDDARKYAALVAAHREKMAEMLGVTAEEYHAANPIEFRREGVAPANPAPDVLNQPAKVLTPEEIEIKTRELADKVPGFGAIAPYLAPDERADLRAQSAEKLVRLFEEWPSAEEMAAVAYSGRAKRGWYERSALALLDIFGPVDAPRFAGLLAALSPQTSVEGNAINAIKTWVNWDVAGRPTDRAAILEILGQSVQGGKGVGSVLNAWIGNSITALTTESPYDIVLSGPKVNSFMLNLMGVMDEVTNDAWMANFALIDQAVFAGKNGGKGFGYRAASAVVRSAAETLTRYTGEMWTPAEVQETVWSWVKTLTEKRARSGPVSAAKILEAGGLTHDHLASTPDFAQLFVRGVYRRALEIGGYNDQLETIERSGRAYGPPVEQGSTASAEGSGIPQDAFDRHLQSAAARIDQRYAERYAAKADDRQLTFFQSEVDEGAPVPLAGLPTVIKVDGVPREFGPHQPARDAARRVAERIGRVYTPPTTYAKVDVERAQRIAAAYEAMEHQPNNPEVKAAYDAMIAETLIQWDEIKKTGLQVEFITGDDPYGNPRNAILDVVENNHLWVFPTDSGFGSSDLDVSDNPLLAVVPGEMWSGQPVRVNDVFRVVHDYFGHIAEGVGFRAAGEENAWRMHSAMFSPLARKALTSETRGQNSWVNFGPNGAANQTADGASTTYADQKIGLLPDWVVNEGATDVEPAPVAAWTGDRVDNLLDAFGYGQSDPAKSKAWATMMSPTQFLNLTLSAEGQETLASFDPARTRARPLDAEKLAAETQPIFLIVNRQGEPSNFQKERGITSLPTITAGHEGRHRMTALRAAGIEQVPVVIIDQSSAHVAGPVKREVGMTLVRQSSRLDANNNGVENATLGDMVPISHENRDEIARMFGPQAEAQVFFQDDQAIFYSALERAVAKGQNKATGEQWLATLRNAPGIKTDELEWTGLVEWLQDKEGPVTRDEVAEFVQTRGVQVEEVLLGSDPLENEEPQREDFEDEASYEEAYSWWSTGDDIPSPVQFREWSSDPSNDTYRELLITLPLGERGNPKRAASTHWGQPGVVAHARFMDKTDVDGKRVLFIEEVQSDWHQKGRDQGYAVVADPKRLAAAERAYQAAKTAEDEVTAELGTRMGEVWQERYDSITDLGQRNAYGEANWQPQADWSYHDLTRDAGKYRSDGEVERLLKEANAARLRVIETGQVVHDLGQTRGIPDAPFKKSWPALVMKRMIRWAAENGYDKIAWTTGVQQSERYNLSHAVGASLTFEGVYDADGYLINISHESARAVVDAGYGRITERAGGNATVRMGERGLRDAFGDDVAQRIMSSEPGDTLEGDDLNVGGEGMRAFYDRNLVNITNDIIKKHGAKVGPVELFLDDNRYYGVKRGTQPGFEITPKMREAALGGFPLFQTRPQGARGQVEITNGKSVITLFDRADPSTLIHELGHVFFEEMKRNAASASAPAELAADWATLKNWLAANGAPVIDNVITRDGHELIARGFERYAMEGNSPNSALAAVFTRFRQWLMAIYKTVDVLRAPITPEVRQVFDRWFATEAAIDRHNTEQAKPLLDVKPDTMTAAEFDAYRSSVITARNDAVNRLLEKTMRSIRARRLDEFRGQRNEVRGIVAEEVNNQPVFKALDALRKTSAKLNRNWLVERYGEDALNRLPKGPILVSNSGEDAEIIAEMTDFASAAEMVEALFDLAQQTEMLRASGDKRSVRDKMIADRVNAEMEASGASDPLRDDAIEAEALAAIHGEKQGEVFSTELKALGRLTGGTVTPYRAARDWAARRIREGKVHEVASKSAIQRYARAAAKEGRLAEEAYVKGDHRTAFRHKQAQLINHALVAEARKAGDDVDRIVKRLGRISRRAAQKSIDAAYFDRVQQLLALFEFKSVSQKMLDEAEGFTEWAAKQAESGFEVIAPSRLLLGRDHYTRVTVSTLFALDDTVASLMTLGRLKQRLADAQEKRTFDAFVDDVVNRVKNVAQRKLKNDRNEKPRWGAGGIAGLIKVETIAEELDGGTQGPMNRLLVERYVENENRRSRLRDSVLMPIAEAYNAMSSKDKRRLNEKTTIAEFPHRGTEGDPRNGQPTTMTRMELLAVALNTGNMSNLDKLSRGEGWSVAAIDRVIQRELTQSDWAFVGTVWRSIDRLWPAIAATEREMSGVVPERVQGRVINTPFGPVKGGYYPVVYDPTRSQMAENNAAAAVEDLFGMKAGVGTPKGHTIARTDAAAPIMLSVEGVLFNHVEKAITRAVFAPYARDVLRVTKNARVRGIVDLRLGSEYRQTIQPWLQRVINSGALDTRGLKWWENLLRQARVNLTIVSMGFRVSTGVAQVSGLMSSAGRIGPLNVANGIRYVLQNPVAAQRFVYSRSEEMERRSSELNVEVANVHRRLKGKSSALGVAQSMAFWHIAMVDMYVVSMPTWLGAHAKAIRAGMTDEQASREGDKAVRMSQGSGREGHLANYQNPHSEALRWLTLFYTYFNVFLQSQWQAVRDVKRGGFGNYRKAAVATFWFAMAAPLADALLSGDLPDGGDDDEESWFEWTIRNIFYHQFSGIPIARDLANYGERQQIGQFATLGSSPISRIEEVVSRAVKTIDKAVDVYDEDGNLAPQFGEEPDNWVKTAIETPGYFIGLPTGQPATTSQFLWDVNTGEAEPSTLGDWYWGLTRGRLPETAQPQEQ